MDSLRTFFSTSISDIFEDEPTIRPRSTSCPRSVGVGAARRQMVKGDTPPAAPASSAARPNQLRSRPSQNERGSAKPKLVVSRGKQKLDTGVGFPFNDIKVIALGATHVHG